MPVTTLAKIILPLGAALALTACAEAEPEVVGGEVGAEDLSGGELISTDPTEERVDVDLPETAMTNASDEEIAAAKEEAAKPEGE